MASHRNYTTAISESEVIAYFGWHQCSQPLRDWTCILSVLIVYLELLLHLELSEKPPAPKPISSIVTSSRQDDCAGLVLVALWAFHPAQNWGFVPLTGTVISSFIPDYLRLR